MTDKLKAQFSAYSWLLTNLTGEKPFGDPIPSVSETKFSEKLVSYMEELRHSIMEKMSSLNTEEQRKKVTDHMEEIGSQAQSIVEPMMDLAQKGARNIGDMVKAVWNVNNEKLADVQRKHKKIFERFKESISDRVKDSWQWEKLKGDWMGLFNSVFWSASSGTAAVDDFDFPDKPETPVTDGEIKPANDFCPKSQVFFLFRFKDRSYIQSHYYIVENNKQTAAAPN